MSDLDMPSPCNKVCTLDARRICIGCGRSASEIAEWPDARAVRRMEIVVQARHRLEEMHLDARHQAQ